jgi:hypothetical protein
MYGPSFFSILPSPSPLHATLLWSSPVEPSSFPFHSPIPPCTPLFPLQKVSVVLPRKKVEFDITIGDFRAKKLVCHQGFQATNVGLWEEIESIILESGCGDECYSVKQAHN